MSDQFTGANAATGTADQSIDVDDPVTVAADIDGADGEATDIASPEAPTAAASQAQADLAERTADLQRLSAEYANYRRRADRERTAAREAGKFAVISELLTVIDDLDRARVHGDLESGPFKSVAAKLSGLLEKQGVTAFGEVGDLFDPTLHEAVQHDGDGPEPVIGTVLRKGYRSGERVLRHAMVMVTDADEAAEDRHGHDFLGNEAIFRLEIEQNDRFLVGGLAEVEAEELPSDWPFLPYIVPASPAEPEHFFRVTMEPEQFADEVGRLQGLWPSLDTHLGAAQQSLRPPARALSHWHLALALAAGAISGVVRSKTGRVLVVKGDTHKDKTLQREFTEREDGSIAETRILTDKFVPVIRAWDMTPGSPTRGEVLTIR